MRRFAVAETKLRKPTVKEERLCFFTTAVGKVESDSFFFLFFFSNCVTPIDHQKYILEKLEKLPLDLVCVIPNSHILIFRLV